jgi:ankyrin repeat protein
VDERDRGCSALWCAARHGHPSLVEALADRHADVDLVDSHHERTPLHVAAAYAHVGVVRQLLQRGAVVDWPDREGCTALARAAGRGFGEVVRLLVQARNFDPSIVARESRARHQHHRRGE